MRIVFLFEGYENYKFFVSFCFKLRENIGIVGLRRGCKNFGKGVIFLMIIYIFDYYMMCSWVYNINFE